MGMSVSNKVSMLSLRNMSACAWARCVSALSTSRTGAVPHMLQLRTICC